MTGARRVAGLVLAAGAARRFGAIKQLAELDGRPLLEHVLAAVASAPELDRVAVTLGAHADRILATVDLHGSQAIVVADWAEGQAASLRAGVAALTPHADAIVIALGDQPRLDPATIARLMTAWDGSATPLRAAYEGIPGHPVLLPAPLFPAVAELRGDEGARRLLDEIGVHDIDCGSHPPLDVDTSAQLRALRSGRR